MKRHKKQNKPSSLYFFLLVGAIALFSGVYIIREYNNFTIIEFKYLLLLFTISGLVTGCIFYRLENDNEDSNNEIFAYFWPKILVYGSISCALLLYSNKLLSREKEYVIVSRILATHEEYRRSPNYIITDLKGSEREINIHDHSFQEIQKFNFVQLTMKDGFWNFPIIMEVKLVNK